MQYRRLLLERGATYLCHNVAVSTPVAETVPGGTTRIPNTFRSIFDQPGVSDEEREGLLFVGRLVSRKGVDVALDALHQLRERRRTPTLTICGDGPEREALEEKARRLGLKESVSFEGWTSPDALASQYRQAAITLVPSRKEPFGIVALESIASQCPVVATNVGGLPEAIGDCGLLVEPESPPDLADAIEKALKVDVRRSLREAMRQHIDRHRIEHIAAQYIDILDAVVTRAQR
jgi:glycosyltransferase involved in cell wall biosynthesis